MSSTDQPSDAVAPGTNEEAMQMQSHSAPPLGTGQMGDDANVPVDPKAGEAMSNSTSKDSVKSDLKDDENTRNWQGSGKDSQPAPAENPASVTPVVQDIPEDGTGESSSNSQPALSNTANEVNAREVPPTAGGGAHPGMMPPPLEPHPNMNPMGRRGLPGHEGAPHDQDHASMLSYGANAGGAFHPHNHSVAPPLGPHNPYHLDSAAHTPGAFPSSGASHYNTAAGAGGGGGRDSRAGSTLPFTDNMVAAAKIRAAGMAAAAAERDYQFAALNLQRQLEAAEFAKKRQMLFPGDAASAPGARPGGNNPHGPPVEDDLEVAQACLNLRQDLKEDPDYLRYLQSRNFLHQGMLLPGAGRSDRLPASARGMMQPHHPMDSHMLSGAPGASPGNLSMMGDPNAHPNHFYGSMDGFDAASAAARSSGLGGIGGAAGVGGMKADPYGSMMGGMAGMRGAADKFNQMHGGMGNSMIGGGHMNDNASMGKSGRKPSRPEITRKEPKKGKRPADMPRRPLSAYNFFFSEERERVLASLPDPAGENQGDDANDQGKDKKDSEATTEASTDASSSKDKVKEETSETKAEEPSKAAESTQEEDKKQSNTERLLALRNSQRNVRRPHRKTHGKIGFKALAKLIGERWRALPAEKREYYTKLAETDLARYKEQMKEYHRKNKWSFLQQGKEGTPSN